MGKLYVRYVFEHSHRTRGSMVHHFPTQTISDKKILPKTLLKDRINGESSGIYLALEMNRISGMITMEIWAPNDRWFGIGWNGHSEVN